MHATTGNMFQFNYTQQAGLTSQSKVSMEFGERSADEMCEYFQRFLTACGYYFDEGEQVQVVKKKEEPASIFGNEFLGYVDENCNTVGWPSAPFSYAAASDDIITFGNK